jgi:L-lactate dehydrogenase complex protein LldE
MNVQLFIPCFVDQLYPETALNMVKVLRKAGCTPSYNVAQTCCGQPAFNAGFWDAARAVCTKFLADFNGSEPIIVPSASCVGFIKNHYAKLFAGTPGEGEATAIGNRIYELSDFLVNVLGVTQFGARLDGTATYHDSCAALRECSIKEEPRLLLSNVEGLQLKEMNDVETCCGFGGTFAVKFEAISAAMAEQKARHAGDTGARYLIPTDHSCLMHLQGFITKNNLGMQSMHLADVLAQGW